MSNIYHNQNISILTMNYLDLTLGELPNFTIKLSDGVLNTYKEKLMICPYFKTYIESELNTDNILEISDCQIKYAKPIILFIYLSNGDNNSVIYETIYDKYLLTFEFDEYMELFKFASMWCMNNFINLSWAKLITKMNNELNNELNDDEIDILIESTVYFCDENTPLNLRNDLQRIICKKGLKSISNKIFDSVIFNSMSIEYILHLCIKYNRIDKLIISRPDVRFSHITDNIRYLQMENFNYEYSFIMNMKNKYYITDSIKEYINDIKIDTKRIACIKKYHPFEFIDFKYVGSGTHVNTRIFTEANNMNLTISLFINSRINVDDIIVFSQVSKNKYQSSLSYASQEYFTNIFFKVLDIVDTVTNKKMSTVKNKHVSITATNVTHEYFTSLPCHKLEQETHITEKINYKLYRSKNIILTNDIFDN